MLKEETAEDGTCILHYDRLVNLQQAYQSADTSISATMLDNAKEGEKVRLMRRLFNPLLVQPPCRS